MMDAVDLLRCERCRLIWVEEGDEKVCPRCRLNHSIPSHPVMVAGVEVPIRALRDFGMRKGLLDSDVRKNLDKLVLGDRCPHGYMTFMICSRCCSG
jgi:hypothetical protein